MSPCIGSRHFCFLGGGGGFRPWQAGEARSPEGTREISWSQGSGATIVPQGDAVADMTHREDKLILMPGNGAGTPVGIPACHRASGVGDAGARQTSDHRAARTKRVEEDALWGPRVQV
jgi:hypothetical protein